MKRWDVINRFIEENEYKDYLEIGLQSGLCRDNIIAPNKTTVDPDERSNNPTHLMTSDEFFEQNEETFDVVFIDGLHHGDQVLKDIENSLEVLNEGGMIFCHDMLPNSEEVQRVPRPMPEYIWTGDVWKAWARLMGTRGDLEMFIAATDWGVGVIKRGSQEIVPELDIPIEEMDWEFFKAHSKNFNVKNVGDF
jgi:SAM-dependent methyltransferase